MGSRIFFALVTVRLFPECLSVFAGICIEAEVEEDGSFSIALPSHIDTSYILIALDEDNQGFVSMPFSGDDSLIMFPSGNAVPEINLGIIDPLNGDEYEAELTANETASLLNMSVEDLYYMSRMDDMAKNALNYYNTYNPDTQEYFQLQKATLINNSFETMRNKFSQPGNIDSITFQLNINLINPFDHNYTDIQNSSMVIKVYPSGPVLYDVDSWGTHEFFGPENPFSTDEPEHLGHWFISGETADLYGFSFSIVGDIPPTWTFEYNGVEKGSLRVEFFDPFLEADGATIYRYFFPSINATTTPQGLITQLDILFYLYNPETSNYELFSDEILNQYGGYSVSYQRLYEDPDNPGESLFIEESIDGSSTITDFTEQWIFDDDSYGYAFISLNTAIGEMPFNFYYKRD